MYLYLLFILLINILKIFASIQTIKVHENINVTITCVFNQIESNVFINYLFDHNNNNNYSENIILWYRNDTQVIGVNSISNNPNKYLLNQTDNYTYELTIINIQLESAGLYKCQNFRTKKENHFQVIVMVPPSHLRLIPSHQFPVVDGTFVTFNCTSERVYPNPIFEWYKNNKLLQRSIGNQTDSIFFSSSSILTLFLTPADHNHILRCQVSNEASINQTNIDIQMEILFKPIIKFLYHEHELVRKNLTMIENTYEVISCQISSNPSIVSKIEWYKNDQLILGENNQQLGINFTGIEKLSCRATNAMGQTEESIHINTLYKPKLSMIEGLTVKENERVVLKCLIDSNPICQQIRWLFDNNELTIQTCKRDEQAEYIIQNINRLQAGNYTCEVKNLLNTDSGNVYEGISYVSTYVRVQYAPIILNSNKKLAVVENFNIRTECLVDTYPKAEIIWFGPSNQKLNLYSKERFLNDTIVSSELHLPSSYSSRLGLYRCTAKNSLGEIEFSIEFQRPSIPDPPIQLQAMNITHSSFLLSWQAGYNGGSDQIFHILILNNNTTDEKYTSLNSIYFDDLNPNTQYIIKIRSKNMFGYSNYSSNIIIQTKESWYRLEDFPQLEKLSYVNNKYRVQFQLTVKQSKMILLNQFCIKCFNSQQISSCIPLHSIRIMNNQYEINIKQIPIRYVKLCLINQTDICTKSILIPKDDIQFITKSSEIIFMILGGIFGLAFVLALIILFLCLRQDKRAKTNLKQVHSVSSVKVSDTNTCLSYPTRTVYYNDETTGVYSIQEKKNSYGFDSGMLSNNSDSVGSSDFYDRSDGEYLVNEQLSSYIINKTQENLLNGRISSEEESGFSTPTKSYPAKKLVYEVVV